MQAQAQRKKIVFLYSELAEYFLTCINKLSENYPVEIHIVRWPINKEAPFKFTFSEKIVAYEKKAYAQKDLMKLIAGINPDVIYCSGWMDKEYLSICKVYKDKIPVIVGFDNHWEGSLKQYLASALSSFTIQKYFTHCWIPGLPQYEFAKHLGFKEEHILEGFYSADVTTFHQQYLNNKELKQSSFPKKFIYVGRYYEFKGIKDLWTAFIEIQNETPNEWELWCLGTGDLIPVIHPKIRHFGFVQPAEMKKYISETSVFVLPSHFEPWGVVVHEFSAAGFPLLCSNKVGAASAFLEDGKNGFLFQSGNVQDLKAKLSKIIALKEEELILMGEKSVEKAMQITPEKWANTLMRLLNN